MKKIAIGLAAAAAAVFSSAASAQAFVNVAAGTGQYSLDCSGTTSCDKSGTAFKLATGYRTGPVSFEAGFVDYGKSGYAFFGGNVSIKSSGPFVGIAADAPLSPTVGLIPRVGFSRLKTKGTVSSGFFGSASESDTNTTPYGGLGLYVVLSKNARLEFSAEFTRAEFDDEKEEVKAFFLGARFYF